MSKPYVTVGEIAEYLECRITGDAQKKIFGISLMDDSTEDMLTYVPYKKIDMISNIRAGAILTQPSLGLPLHQNYIMTGKTPYSMLAKTIQFMKDRGIYGNISEKAPEIHETVDADSSVSVGNGTFIGNNTIISHGVVIGCDSHIGKNCIIGANTVIGDECMIGDNVVIGSCCCIGTENFEYFQSADKWVKIPVVGKTVIGDNVRIGGNVVIERATIGTTCIGADSQIENLVQIGHEVVLGRNCHIVACTGIAGWAKIGDNVSIYGQAAVSNNVHIGNNSILLARSGADKDIPENTVVSGYPAQEHKTEMRYQAFLRKLFRSDRKGCENK